MQVRYFIIFLLLPDPNLGVTMCFLNSTKLHCFDKTKTTNFIRKTINKKCKAGSSLNIYPSSLLSISWFNWSSLFSSMVLFILLDFFLLDIRLGRAELRDNKPGSGLSKRWQDEASTTYHVWPMIRPTPTSNPSYFYTNFVRRLLQKWSTSKKKL